MLRSRSAHALAVLAMIVVASSIPSGSRADTFVAEDFYLGSPYLDPATHKAVQEALKNKGFYFGPIDGEFGEASKAAVLKFRTANHLLGRGATRMKLDKPLVLALFGVRNLSVERWQDEQCLLSKLGKLTEEEVHGACRKGVE